MKRPKYVVRLLAVIALLSMMLVGTAATATAQVTEDVEFPDLLTGDFNEIYFAAVGNGEDFGLGAAQTSITVQNIDDEDGFIFIFRGTGDDYEEVTYAQLNAGASKTFTADDLGVPEGEVNPIIVAGYDSLGFDETIVEDYIGIAGVAKQAVTGDALPYTTANDTSVSGYNSVSGREVGFTDELYLPIVQTNCGPGGCWDTVVRVSNVGFFANAAATIRFFPADDGSGSLQTGFQIEALLGLGETWSVNLSELVPEGWVGSAHIFSDDQVVAIADRFKAGTDMWITNTASNAYAESEYQFGAPYVLFAPDVRLDYNGWNTGINVANTVDMENQVNIQYFGNNGNAPQGQSQRLAAQGMTYFYNPSDPSEDDCNQPADQVPTCDFVGGAVIISTSPVSVAVDGVKYFGNDENVGQAFSYAATANVFEFQAAPLVQKGTASTGMGDTSGINFMNPNSEATFVVVDWVNPSGFQADNFGDSVVWVPGFSTGFVYTMFQINLPNGFTGSAIVTSELPIAATTANVNYAVNGDGTVVWNLYNPCGFFRFDACEFVPEPEPLGTKVIDTNVEGALVCVYAAGVDQDGKPTPIDATEDDCELILTTAKGGDGGQGDPDTFFASLGDDSSVGLSYDDDNNELVLDVQVEDLDANEDYDVVIAGFGGCDLNNDGDCDDVGEIFGGDDATCDVGGSFAGMGGNEFAGFPIIGFMAMTDEDGDLVDSFETQLNAADEQAIGNFEDNVVAVVDEDTGEIVACGIIEAGTFRLETPAEAAARLGAVAVGVTDEDGNVEFDLPAGDYFAVVTADGYELAVEEFDLESGQTEINEVNLTAIDGVDTGILEKFFLDLTDSDFDLADADGDGTIDFDELDTFLGGLTDEEFDEIVVDDIDVFVFPADVDPFTDLEFTEFDDLALYASPVNDLGFIRATLVEGEYNLCWIDSDLVVGGEVGPDAGFDPADGNFVFGCEVIEIVAGETTELVNDIEEFAIVDVFVYTQFDTGEGTEETGLGDVTVTIRDTEGNIVANGATGAAGNIDFLLPAGTYTSSVEDECLEGEDFTFTVAEGDADEGNYSADAVHELTVSGECEPIEILLDDLVFDRNNDGDTTDVDDVAMAGDVIRFQDFGDGAGPDDDGSYDGECSGEDLRSNLLDEADEQSGDVTVVIPTRTLCVFVNDDFVGTITTRDTDGEIITDADAVILLNFPNGQTGETLSVFSGGTATGAAGTEAAACVGGTLIDTVTLGDGGNGVLVIDATVTSVCVAGDLNDDADFGAATATPVVGGSVEVSSLTGD